MNKTMAVTGLTLCLGMNSLFAAESFNSYRHGNFEKLQSIYGQFTAAKGHAELYKKSADGDGGSLRVLGGKNKQVVLEINEQTIAGEVYEIGFCAERWTGGKPFEFQLEAKIKGKWETIHNGKNIKVGGFSPLQRVRLKKGKLTELRFTCTSPEKSGVLIDSLTFYNNKKMVVGKIIADQKQTPLLKRKDDATLISFVVEAEGMKEADSLIAVDLDLTGTTKLNDIEELSLYAGGSASRLDLNNAKLIGKISRPTAQKVSFSGTAELSAGMNQFFVVCKVKQGASLLNRVDAAITAVHFKKQGKKRVENGNPKPVKRIGFNVAHSGDEVVRTSGESITCKRFRIPGMVTSKAGTVLAVYDLRWFQNGDLPGDVDVGLSRSTDGGKSWEAPRPVLDMQDYLGQPENKNGVGDPAILVDRKTGDIFISGLLAHGLSSGWYWGKSKPGMDPEETGQVIINKSSDDGKTWSKPLNITSTIKDPEWQLMLQGPGKGISMRDGTLVFAFQYKGNLGSKDHPKYSARSSIMYSKNHGKSWVVAPGVDYHQETTEAQVVELDDGSLMLNCRISAGGRAVFTTDNLGKSWKLHKTSGRGTFNMTGCMSSLVRYSSVKDGDKQSILLFSGPADGGKKRRSHMSIRYSLDEGETWSTPYLLDELGGAYSCLTIIGKGRDKKIGIIYEGSQSNMTFEKLTLDEISESGR